jgi:hypothetical protein
MRILFPLEYDAVSLDNGIPTFLNKVSSAIYPKNSLYTQTYWSPKVTYSVGMRG